MSHRCPRLAGLLAHSSLFSGTSRIMIRHSDVRWSVRPATEFEEKMIREALRIEAEERTGREKQPKPDPLS